MAEEPKPIKTERIDNPDGTYTIKEIYKTTTSNGYTSCEDLFDCNDKHLSGKYYTDKNFGDLLYSITNIFNSDGSYETTQIYEKMSPWGIAIKAKCDNKKRVLKNNQYADKCCTELLCYEIRTYNSDGDSDYISKTIWPKNQYSAIGEYINKQLVREIVFDDIEFSNKYSETTFNYKNKYRINKIVFEKPYDYSWLSIIEKYDKDHNLIYGEYYKDKDFKILDETKKRKTYKNGSYRDIIKRTIPDEIDWHWFYEETLYDKNNRKLSIVMRTSPSEATQSTVKEWFQYHEDGSYEQHGVKDKISRGYQSYISKYNNNQELITTIFYKDSKFKNVYSIAIREPSKQDHYRTKNIEDDYFYNEHYKSYTQEANFHIINNVNSLCTEQHYYKNADFTELLVSRYYVFNKNINKYEVLIEYENDQGGWYSKLIVKDHIYYDKSKIFAQKWYVDKECNELFAEENTEYLDDNDYICKRICYKDLKDGEYHFIEHYKNNKLVKKMYYKDKKLTQLYATEKYEYFPNGKQIVKTVMEELYKNELSSIEYSNNKDEITFSKGYIDKEFKNLNRKTWIKYIKNYQIRLRIYTQKQGEIYTEIEKYDKNKNLIYKKQYQFKGILAHTLFWLAR